MTQQSDAYPVQLSVDYPDGGLNRLSTFFRLILVIPIIIVQSFLGAIFFPIFLMIRFRRKYPRWWFDWNLELVRFSSRVSAYMLLLRDEYPSTDEEQAVHIEIPYPDVERDLNRWLPLIKWLLAIPHYIVLWLLSIVLMVIVIIAWFAILFTGRYPRGMFDLVVGVMQWSLRVQAYAFLLTTDRYPPFSMRP